MSAPISTVTSDTGMVTGNGMAGEALSGVPAPAVVIAPEAEPVVEHVPGAPIDRLDVPPAWPGRAPWESTGN
jgi:hypothetical protein